MEGYILNIFCRSLTTLGLLFLWGCTSLPAPDIAEAEASVDPAVTEATVAPVVQVQDEPLPPPEDLWERIRRQLSFHTLDNERIQAAREDYLAQPRYMQLITPRAQRYLYYLVSEAERRDLPVELALLPLVESALNPFAISPQGAAGLWQFMPGTADHLGMRRDWWYDARFDIRESTDYALDYLEKLHNDFDGDWLLALAAYNAGENRVKRSLARQRRAGLADDYWSLPLPRETEHYLPRLLALSTIIAFDDALGVDLPHIPNEPGFVVIDTGGQIEMLRAAKLAGLSLEELRRYNPGYLRWATVPEADYDLLVPPAAEPSLRLGLSTLPASERVTWQHYRIRRGDSLSTIARRFDARVDMLREVNNVRGTFIRAGDTLMIPDNTAWRDSLALAENSRRGAKQGYSVRSGDSLYSIALRHNVSIDELINWNQLDPRDYLQPGQALTLYVDGS